MTPLTDYFRQAGEDFRVLIVPDHRTPLRIRTHSADPVPYVIYDSRKEEPEDPGKRFHEKSGAKGRKFNSGYELADFFFEK